MKMKTIFAGIAACAIASSAMVLAVGAETINEKISLNSQDEDAKIWQYDLKKLNAGGGTIEKITFDVTCPFAETGWCGGGGALGMNFGEQWYQVDFGPGSVAEGEMIPDTFSVSLDIPATYKDTAQDLTGDGILQLGWWWGAGDTCEITNLNIYYSAAATTASSDGSTTTTTTTTKAGGTTTTTKAGETKTGDAGVGVVAAALTLAGAAAVVARKKD